MASGSPTMASSSSSRRRYAFDDINGIHLSLFNKAMDQLFPHIESPDPDINNTGIYRVPRTIQLPPDEGEGKRLVRFYYITDPGSGIADFHDGKRRVIGQVYTVTLSLMLLYGLAVMHPKRMKHWDAVEGIPQGGCLFPLPAVTFNNSTTNLTLEKRHTTLMGTSEKMLWRTESDSVRVRQGYN